MEPLTAVLAIAAVFIGLAAWLAHTDGLAFLSPKTTRGLQSSAQLYCSNTCREAGNCPLTHSADRAVDCPLFKYVAADTAIAVYGSPFESVTAV
jgi:hypothetical protein